MDADPGTGGPGRGCRLQAQRARTHSGPQGGSGGGRPCQCSRDCVVSGKPGRGVRAAKRPCHLRRSPSTHGAIGCGPAAPSDAKSPEHAASSGLPKRNMSFHRCSAATTRLRVPGCFRGTAVRDGGARIATPAPRLTNASDRAPRRFRPAALRCLVQFAPVGPVAQRLVQGTHQ
jgi:hypothetical protein